MCFDITLTALGGIIAILVHFIGFGIMPDGHNVLSRVFHLSHMKFNDTKRFLDPENLCLDTSLAALGVEIVISYKIIIFHQFLTKKSPK